MVLAVVGGFAVAAACGGKTDSDRPSTGSAGTDGAGASGGSTQPVDAEAAGAGGTSGGGGASGGTSGETGAAAGTSGATGGTGGAAGDGSEVAAPEVSVLLVVDKSGSLMDTPEGYSTNKWDALRSALGSTLTRLQDALWVGLELFPTTATPGDPIPHECGDRCCEMPADSQMNVDVGPGAETAAEVISVLDTSSPAGGTPTSVALARAYDYFATGPGQSLTGERYVLLATDGPPNCNPNITCDAATCIENMIGCTEPDPRCCRPEGPSCCEGGASACLDHSATVEQVEMLHALGVRTVILLIPGWELSMAFVDYFDGFARAGGHPNPEGPHAYYRVDAEGGTAELQATLDRVLDGLVR